MKNLILVCFISTLVGGCAHCSVTKTEFNGKKSGINPYGSGDIHVVRESYWGTYKQCVDKLMKKD